MLYVAISSILLLAYIAILLRRDRKRQLAGIRAALAPLVGIRSDLDIAFSASLTRSIPRPSAVPQAEAQALEAERASSEELTCMMSRNDLPPAAEPQEAEGASPPSRLLYPAVRPPPPSTGPITPTRLSADIQAKSKVV